MPEHNNYGTSSSNVQNATPRGESENERIERAERVNAGRRIIRVGNRRMRNPNYRGSPPPYRRHTKRTRRLNETARHINRRADILRGKVPSPLEAHGPNTFKEFLRNLMNGIRLVAEEPVILTEFRQSFTVDVPRSSSFLLTGVNDRMPRCPASKTLTSLPRKVRS
ncbi:hypothetical protein SCLCIDRAFT_30178 [Scleroderma citrinum Foug A]|uniref:Uncharacterized protein n=1 Tax=Scleroderma citrinum Foug A TaxID=1036808 RepID=A0A0C3DI27_9AGAM|nr:hypothetical protein SCLCIDRAFT_30178 [Scleroderma citrinum Foug A]